ncbi:putative aminopeptidase W07G4.4 [Styela clava]|uniref:putative aminopeptidase W07G4.4 n=1 Tax=Styela clava TaxID=7725 RepID=UPI0019394219|nr:putative aminopeptidase W07G4.4 [Styela clava]
MLSAHILLTRRHICFLPATRKWINHSLKDRHFKLSGTLVSRHISYKYSKMKLPCEVVRCSSFDEGDWDGILVVTDSLAKLDGPLVGLRKALEDLKQVDAAVGKDVCVAGLAGKIKRVVFAPTGPLNRDYDDVRRFSDAAEKGIKRAIKAGCKSLVVVTTNNEPYPQARIVTALGALQALYVPIEIRDDCPDRVTKMNKVGLWNMDKSLLLDEALKALESGRLVCRDIGGSDPEKMAAPNVAEYVQKVFENSSVLVSVISDVNEIEKSYPCLGAVNRCAKVIPRHNARVIKLQYSGEGPITDTLFLVGKGVTYDTGGADIKAGGVMAGMHRDKCGAAAVAGFFQVLNVMKPKHLKVIGTMSMVRNSVGANCYVSDEIITTRAGVRVRVGNTDAEGRMAMLECLCEAKEIALNEVNPHLYTIATLTGHSIIAMGPNYFCAMDNGPAKITKNVQKLQESGEAFGDPCEISTIRRDDYEFHTGKSEYEDVLQCNNLPSTRTPRGHQSPSAFMIMASGLDKHGVDSEKPLKYTHLDVAGSSGPFPGVPTGSPVVALAAHYKVF